MIIQVMIGAWSHVEIPKENLKLVVTRKQRHWEKYDQLTSSVERVSNEAERDHYLSECNVFRELYPELLKRLDDSNDVVRVATCKCFVSYFKALPAEWSGSLFRYIVSSLFIHLDDPERLVQQ